MRVISARNVNDALMQGLMHLDAFGHSRDSRNGAVMVSPTPVTTIYNRPQERVLFNEKRDANPFFHLFEALWMLAGRNDVEYVARFAKNMRSYSDDGETLWGAYGWRWRSFFGHDQLKWIIERLHKHPDDRRCYLGMWDPNLDPEMSSDGKDVPCNVGATFQIMGGALDLTVFNRSNDIIWGAYGANAVHFSMLQEYVAMALNVPIGRYYQVSVNYHAYRELYDKLLPEAQEWANNFDQACHYTSGVARPWPLMTRAGYHDRWDEDLLMFLEDPNAIGFREPFFRKIVKPMWMAHQHYKEKQASRYAGALEILSQMPDDNDWRGAAEQWIIRRRANALAS